MTAYDDLPLLVPVIAEAVCRRPYTGQDCGSHGAAFVAKTEKRRRAMGDDDVRAFAIQCDTRCREAYAARCNWFVKIAAANGDKGRDLLYSFVAHWLAAYLKE